MSIVSAPMKNDIATQTDIFRFAATLYSETSNVYSTNEAQLQMIKCIYVSCNNACLHISEIIVELMNIYKYHISEDELLSIIKRSKKTFHQVTIDDNIAYKLAPEIYEQTVELQKNGIDFYINLYMKEKCISNIDVCRQAIFQYIYELTTTNINSYQILFQGKGCNIFSDDELSVTVASLSQEEKEMVYDFLAWENNDKNIALTNIVYCCLEYCLLVNGDSPNKLFSATIRKREVYLDTNIIFRILGINGESRRKVIVAFLDKCKQAQIKIAITSFTKKEFFDTIDYYVDQIAQYPRGHIYPQAYEQLADYSIFSFYDEWQQNHEHLSLKYFKIYIKSEYIKFIRQYNVIDAEKIPDSMFDSTEFKEKRNLYSASIKATKSELKSAYVSDDHYSMRDSHDATVTRYIEVLRSQYGETKDIFFVSSDKGLRYWDMTRHDNSYPVIVYPSQLFLVLIKLCGRSINDYDSFVSFINVGIHSQQLTAEKANIIISGISSITEDFETQKLLVDAVYDDEFQNILQHSSTDEELYVQTQVFSQRYLETELQTASSQLKELSEVTQEQKELLDDYQKKQDEDRDIISESKNKISDQTHELEKKREQICSFSEKQILPKFCFIYYIRPALVAAATLLFLVFIAFQFFFNNESWNFAVIFFSWVDTTMFGQLVGDFVYAIDALIGGIIFSLCKKYLCKRIRKTEKESLKTSLIEKYITDNGLS